MRINRPIKIVAALFAAAVVLAACSSDSDSDSSADTTEATTSTTAAATTDTTAATADIVDTAVAAGDFTTLASALEAADLVDTLKGDGPFTVFAPTDDAFAALPAGTLDSLLADPEALANVLTYHVVAGEVHAADLTDGQVIETVNGDTLTVSIDGDTVKINDATVTTADVEASNGVIHVIDKVLVPAS